jgi:glycerol-3-phosphate dehydrogenase (NAD(P)+)
MRLRRAAVVGAGAWGTSLARLAALNGNDVTLWTRDAAHAAELAADRENRRRLPGVPLPAGVAPTSDLAAVAAADLCILAVPAQSVAGLVGALGAHLRVNVPVVIAAKGFDAASGRTLGGIVSGAIPASPPLVLSGPSFAEDVARDLPTAVTLAGRDDTSATAALDVLARPTFRIYLTDDVAGTETGGAVKNVLAIAAGVVEGRGLGASARAALIARGFAELGRYAEARGGRRETVAGLSGLGDLVLTCSSAASRNFSFGIALGRGASPDEARAAARGVVEGASTAPVVVADARARGIEMPISAAVAGVVGGTLSIDAAIEGLLARPLRREG